MLQIAFFYYLLTNKLLYLPRIKNYNFCLADVFNHNCTHLYAQSNNAKAGCILFCIQRDEIL